MPHYSFSLVFFTLFVQLVIGLTWVYSCPKVAFEQGSKEDKRFWFMLVAFLVFGFIASTTHLADPLHAPYSITQLSHSWLSREILTFALFGVIVLLRTSNVIKASLDWLFLPIGVIVLWVFSHVYITPTIPLFDTPVTTLYFIATACLIGGALHIALYQDKNRSHTATILTFVGFALTVIVLCYYLVTMASLMHTPLAQKILPNAKHFTSLLLTGSLLLILGMAFFISPLLFRTENGRKRYSIACICLLLGSITLRMLFYLLIPMRIGF